MLTGYKTVLVAAALIIVGALQSLDWVHLIPNDPSDAGKVVAGLGALMAVLRFFTNTPVGSK